MAKSKWDEVKDKLILVEGWARSGLIEEQIAANLGISTATLYKYKLEHEEFLNAIKKGKEVADFEVEGSLFKRANGYTYLETKTTTNADGSVIVTETVKEVIPDTTAQIFWLKNRKPKEWRDKQEIESKNTNDNTIRIKLEGDLSEWAK